MTISNKQVIVVIGFTIAVIMAFFAGNSLGELYVKSSLIDLNEKYGILQSEYNGTKNLLILSDTQVLNLNPYQYLQCLKDEKIDNVTISVNESRTSFPSSDWSYGDDKFYCFIKSQNGNDTGLRTYQNILILQNLTGEKR